MPARNPYLTSRITRPPWTPCWGAWSRTCRTWELPQCSRATVLPARNRSLERWDGPGHWSYSLPCLCVGLHPPSTALSSRNLRQFSNIDPLQCSRRGLSTVQVFFYLVAALSLQSCIGKMPWRRAWQPTPVFLPGESPWTEEPGGLQSMGSQRVRHDWATECTHTDTQPFSGHKLFVKWGNWGPRVINWHGQGLVRGRCKLQIQEILAWEFELITVFLYCLMENNFPSAPSVQIFPVQSDWLWLSATPSIIAWPQFPAWAPSFIQGIIKGIETWLSTGCEMRCPDQRSKNCHCIGLLLFPGSLPGQACRPSPLCSISCP